MSIPLDALTGLAGGSAVTFTAKPAYGAVFEKWVVNGTDVNPASLTHPNVYICPELTGDLNIQAVFRANDAYTVTVSKNSHGSLSYTLNGGAPISIGGSSTAIPVFKGDTLAFTAVPDQEFMVSDWTIDGTWNQTTAKTWTLSDIGGDRTVGLNFVAKVYYTVSFSAGTNGSISALMDGTYPLANGDRPGGGTDIRFTAAPASGFMVDHWTVNGVTLKTGLGTDYVCAVYDVPALAANTAVAVTFKAEQKWKVDMATPAAADIAGVFSPNDYNQAVTSYVRDGADGVFTVTPHAGYVVSTVQVTGNTTDSFDSVVKNADGSWTCTVNSVKEDLSVTVNTVQSYTVTVGSAAGGTAGVSAASAVAGTRIDLTATPASGYTFSGWTVTPGGLATIDSPSSVSTYFIMPAGNVTVTPVFTLSNNNNNGGGGNGGGGNGGGGNGGGGNGGGRKWRRRKWRRRKWRRRWR